VALPSGVHPREKLLQDKQACKIRPVLDNSLSNDGTTRVSLREVQRGEAYTFLESMISRCPNMGYFFLSRMARRVGVRVLIIFLFTHVSNLTGISHTKKKNWNMTQRFIKTPVRLGLSDFYFTKVVLFCATHKFLVIKPGWTFSILIAPNLFLLKS